MRVHEEKNLVFRFFFPCIKSHPVFFSQEKKRNLDVKLHSFLHAKPETTFLRRILFYFFFMKQLHNGEILFYTKVNALLIREQEEEE